MSARRLTGALRIFRPSRLVSSVACECSHASLKVGEFWQHIEGNSSWRQCFRDEVDPVIRPIPEETRGSV